VSASAANGCGNGGNTSVDLKAALTGCTLTTCRGRFSMDLSLFDKMSNASNNFGVDVVVSAKHS
jgi:hypothetical protein